MPVQKKIWIGTYKHILEFTYRVIASTIGPFVNSWVYVMKIPFWQLKRASPEEVYATGRFSDHDRDPTKGHLRLSSASRVGLASPGCGDAGCRADDRQPTRRPRRRMQRLPHDRGLEAVTRTPVARPRRYSLPAGRRSRRGRLQVLPSHLGVTQFIHKHMLILILLIILNLPLYQ